MNVAHEPDSLLAPYMEDFTAVLDSQRLPSSVLLGYSHGGFFVTWYALTHPERVSALVLLEPAVFSDPADLRERARLVREGNAAESMKVMLRQVEPTVGLDDMRAQQAADRILACVNSERALANELTARAEHPISREQLKELRMPLLLIGGGRSHVKWITTDLSGLLPHANVWWLTNATHGSLTSRDYAATVTKVIDMFIAQVIPDSDDLPPGG